MRDETSETFDKEGLIVKPDLYKRAPLSGTIVAVGSKVPEDEGFYQGQHVDFNKYNIITFNFDFEDTDENFDLDVLHFIDIYWGDEK